MKRNAKRLLSVLLTAVLVLALLPVTASAASSAKNAQQGTNIGTGTEWSFLDNITSDDNYYVSICLAASGTSQNLRASHFGFSIPSDATIDGIKVSIGRKCMASGIVDNLVQLVDANGLAVGDNKAKTDVWPTAETAATYGSYNDMWGTSISAADINDVDFGVQLSVKNTRSDSADYAYVDYITITVTYNTAAPQVATGQASSITATTAAVLSNVLDGYDAMLTGRGFCYGTSANPTTSGSKVPVGTGGGSFFTAEITGLSPNTAYHFRAYATNFKGTNYGADVEFTTKKLLTGISVTTPPTKTSYKEGQSFDPAGMVVTATYGGDPSEAVTGYSISPSGALATTDTSATVSYKLGDVTKTATTPITVTAVAPVSIKAAYTQGGAVYTNTGLNSLKNNLVVTVTNDDASTATLADSDYTLSGTLTAGTSAVTVTHGSLTDTFDVTVTAATYGISMDKSGTQTFTALAFGYGSGAVTPLTVTITNSGNQATGALTVALGGTNSDSFTPSKTSVSSLAPSGTDSFTVKPDTGLTPGTYTATVTVSGGSNITEQAFTVSFTVDPAPVVNATISPDSSSFDKYAPTDILTTITWGSATSITDVKAGGVSVGAGNYSLSGNTLTIKKEYLAAQPSGSLALTVEFNAGTAATLTISISDTTPVNGVIAGAAKDSGNNPISGVTVSLSVSGTVYQATTDSNGTYTILGIPAGSGYAVTASKTGYNSETVNHVTVTAGSTATVDFILTPASGSVAISIAAIPGITAPVRGAAPVTAITETAQYTGTVTWSPNHAAFAGGTVYTATITLTPKAGYTLTGVGANFFTVAGAISVSNAADSRAVTAVFPATSAEGGGSGGSGGGGSYTPAPKYEASVSGGDGSVKVEVKVDANNATAELTAAQIVNGKDIVVNMPKNAGVSNYTLGIPVPCLSKDSGKGSITLNTDAGTITLPDNMLAGTSAASGSKAQVHIGTVNSGDLPKAAQDKVGNHPIVSLSLSIDGKTTPWNNPNAPVTVSIPYTPTAEELKNPEGITVWYIDGSGKPTEMSGAKYDPVTRSVVFTTTHFSFYAVGYKAPAPAPVAKFIDVLPGACYYDAVTFMANKGIASGTGEGKFSPDARLTRGQFITMLLRAYSVSADAKPANNFSDAGDTYYTGYLAAAKRLGISTGVGSNMFAPGKEITRQEMFTLLYNALKAIGQLPQGNSGQSLSRFTDAGDIAPWAKDAMKLLVETGTIGGSGNRLSPKDTTIRAQMVQVLYSLLSK